MGGDTNRISSNNVSLQQQTQKPNPILVPLLHALDPISLILNQNHSNSQSEQHAFSFPLRLTSADSFIMERGPNYNAYAELREKRLRMKQFMVVQEQEQEQEQEEKPKIATTPPTKQVKFQSDLASGRKLGRSASVAQSVPDFSAVLRKENRKPVNTLPSLMEVTPPCKSFSRGNRVLLSSKGSKSASPGAKGGGGCGGGGVLMARKSYASMDELKKLSSATAIAINGEGGRGGRNGTKMMGKTVSGKYRQF